MNLPIFRANPASVYPDDVDTCSFKRFLLLLVIFLLAPLGLRAESVTLNLKDADINAVISTVSEVTGKNFIIDPRVKGKVTIISSGEMDKDEIYQVFLSILAVHGYAAIESGSIIKIVPDANAKQEAVPVISARGDIPGDAYVTRTIVLDHVSAQQLVPILRPLVDQKGHLAAYPPSNILIVSDRAENISRLIKIIQRVDLPSGSEIEIIPLEHASAAEIVRILTTFQQQESKGARQGAGGEESPILISDDRTNSILLGGAKSTRLRMRALIGHLDTPLETEGNIHVVYLRYAQAKDMAAILADVGRSAGPAAKGAKAAAASSDFSVRADESTNALVITASSSLFKSLQSVIGKLDVRRAQVLVEAIIAEMTSDRAAELGVQWLLDGTPSNAGLGAVNFAAGGAGTSIGEIGGAVATGSVPSIPAGLTFGIGRLGSDSFNFGTLIRALDGDGSTNVLSTPTLVTLDNVEAEINVGQEVPFVTGSFSSTGVPGGTSQPTNPFQTINRETIGINLKVKPQINEGNAIRLDIEQSSDSLSSSAGAVDLITNTRSIKTSIMIDDGEIIALGGLITDDVNESTQKVPFLGDLPLLGRLFRYDKRQKRKTNLMVFLHPVIMRDAAMSARMTNSKYSYTRDLQLDFRDKPKLPLISDEKSPLMPTMEEWKELPPPYEPDRRVINQIILPDGSMPDEGMKAPSPGERDVDDESPPSFDSI